MTCNLVFAISQLKITIGINSKGSNFAILNQRTISTKVAQFTVIINYTLLDITIIFSKHVSLAVRKGLFPMKHSSALTVSINIVVNGPTVS